MTSTNHYGNRFGRRLSGFKSFSERVRYGRHGYASLGSVDSTADVLDAEDSKQTDGSKDAKFEENANEGDKINVTVEVGVSGVAEGEGGTKDRSLEASKMPHRNSRVAQTPTQVEETHPRAGQMLLQLQLEKLLREEAIRLVRLIHAENMSSARRFDVFTAIAAHHVRSDNAPEAHVTMAIMFTSTRSSNWYIVGQGVGSFSTPVESLQEFILELRRDLEIRAALPNRLWVEGLGLDSEIEKSLVQNVARDDTGMDFFGAAGDDDGLYDEEGFYIGDVIDETKRGQEHSGRPDSGYCRPF